MIEVADLSVSYGEHKALEDVSLHVEAGEFVLLTGPSGCGKSTLARCLAGLIPHGAAAETVRMSGSVRVDGLLTAEHTLPQLAAHVGLVFQNPATQLFCLTVEEEVAFGPRNLALSPDEVAGRVRFALAAAGIEHLRRRTVNTLSTGEQQRLAIAAVLAMRPRILVLDEPTSNLDLKGTRAVLETLDRLCRQHGLTVLVIEHRLHDLSRLADRLLVMDGGRIVADDMPQRILGQKELLARLGVRYPWHVLQDDWSALLPGGLAPRAASDGGPPLVALQDVEAGYGRQVVLKGFDLALSRGEFVALVGDNGAGKTTVARVLAGLLKPRRGKVIWNAGTRVGLLLQNPLNQLFCDSVEEEVAFGPRNFGHFSAAWLDEVLAVADLQELRARRPYALSSGQQQRTALAAVLSLMPEQLGKPRKLVAPPHSRQRGIGVRRSPAGLDGPAGARDGLLILDEPTMGQDWRHLSGFMDFLSQLNARGMTILLITHDYKLICRYAQRIVVLQNGRIVADGSPRLPLAVPGQPPMETNLPICKSRGENHD